MHNVYVDEGRKHLREKDWVEAIRTLAWAKDIEPDRVDICLMLIDAYEQAAAAENEPDLLQQAFNACRDLRDRRLPMSEAQQESFYLAFVRVRDAVVAARRTGWTPPLPKEEVWKQR